MYRLLKSDADTYLQNRIIDNSYRATDANVGAAGTLDLYKLFDESTLSGTTNPIELSRLLVKFDLNPLRALTGSVLDVGDSSFKVTFRLSDVVGGQPVPSNFTAAIYPVSKSWDEGVGRDVGRYSDLDAANWVTASTSSGLSLWNSPGAAAEGLLGSDDIDVIVSGNLNDGLGLRPLFKTQLFSTGEEDLEVDVTDLVSATLAGQLPDHGFRIAMSGVLETNSSSLFVKRFASRHSTNPRKRPALIVKYDDSLQDDHSNFVFDTTGSLFLFNYSRGTAANILSGTAATPLTGVSALTLKLITGSIAPQVSQSFTASFDVDQYSYGSNFATGVYVATFALSSFETELRNEVDRVGSASFHTVWMSNDETVPFLTGSLVVRRPDLNPFVPQDRQLIVKLPNIRQVYRRSQEPRIRVEVYDLNPEVGLTFSKLPVQRVGKTYRTMYWRLVDIYAGEVVIPFDTVDSSTLLSVDEKGMFFDFFPVDLSIGRVFAFEFLIRDGGEDIIVDKNMPTFRVEA